MSEFLHVLHGSNHFILNKSSIVSIKIETYFRKIEIFMKDKEANRELIYGVGLENDFQKAVDIIQNTLLNK